MFVAVALIWLFIMCFNNLVFGGEYTRLGHVVNAILATSLTVPAVILARRFLDNRSLEGIGLSPLRAGWRSFLIGMGCYLIPAGLALAGALAIGLVEISLETSLINAIPILLGLLLLVFFYEAFPEELVFRGYIYRNLAAAVPRWAAVVGQAAIFGLWGSILWLMVDGVSDAAGRLVLFIVIAMIIGAIRVVTGDVWACIGFHLAFQTVQQFFGGTWAGGVVTTSSPETFESIIFGLIPLALALAVLHILGYRDTDWHVRDPDPPPDSHD